MERRDSLRIRRRVACEFEYDGHLHTAIVVDLSVGGLFLQTDTAISPGVELTLRLRGEPFGAIELRGQVVRRRFTPTIIATMIRRGVGVHLLSAPPAYYEAFGHVEGPPQPVWSALEDLEPPFEREASAAPVTIDVLLTAESPLPAEPNEAKPDEPDESSGDVEEVWESLPLLAPAPASPAAPARRFDADALLVHDAELADVASLLASLGADVISQRAIDPSDLQGWERPPRLIVASGNKALRLAMGPNVEAQGIVAIAVVDSDSQRLSAMLRRQGFRYVVRRPVHPEALRLLLGRALFRGRERRDAARVALGCEVGLRFGLRRKLATLLELSRTGACVLSEEWVEPADRLSLRVPTEVTGNRPLLLSGRVLRSERQRHAGGGKRVAVALRFDRLGLEARARLEALIAAYSLGPIPLQRKLASPGSPPAHAARADETSRGAPHANADPRAAAASDTERRSRPRAPHRREWVALEPDLARVRHALLGIDLSPGGVRIEPHPELVLGDRVRLAIYDGASGATHVVEAEAIRDDGASGILLRFLDVSEDAALEIARMVDGEPQIQAAGAEADCAVVLTELLRH